MNKLTGTVGSVNFGPTYGLSLYQLLPGRRVQRRVVVTSPFVAGEIETAAVPDQTRDTVLKFRARAATAAALQTLIGTLVTAVEAQTWTLAFAVGSSSWPNLTCTRADTDVVFDMAHLRGLTATVYVYTTHNPTASGPI